MQNHYNPKLWLKESIALLFALHPAFRRSRTTWWPSLSPAPRCRAAVTCCPLLVLCCGGCTHGCHFWGHNPTFWHCFVLPASCPHVLLFLHPPLSTPPYPHVSVSPHYCVLISTSSCAPCSHTPCFRLPLSPLSPHSHAPVSLCPLYRGD